MTKLKVPIAAENEELTIMLEIRAAITSNAQSGYPKRSMVALTLSDGLCDHKPIINRPLTMAVPAFTPLAEKSSQRSSQKEGLKKFVGPTIVYSFMQSVGMVDDHLTTCPCK